MQLIQDLKNNFLYRWTSRPKKVDNNFAVILLYHRIVNIESDPQLLAVTPENFEDHLKFLKKNYNILSFQSLLYFLESDIPIPPRSVLISFDDGYYDNFTNAKRIIEANSVPAIFFISTSNIDSTQEYWWDALERCILNNASFPLKIEIDIEGVGVHSYLLDNKSANQKLYDFLIEKLRAVIPDKRDESLIKLSVICNSVEGRQSHRAMSKPELIEFSKSSFVTIGAHAHNHPSLAALDHDVQEREIMLSKSILESIIEKHVDFFSYPFGTIKDYSDTTKNICKMGGFKLAVANYPAKLYNTEDRYALPRYLVRNWDKNEFSKKLNSFFL
ncbi:MAG: polysaccharide deacetylase family protein [Ferruginibacter sp.]